jgi:hypothetical protein
MRRGADRGYDEWRLRLGGVSPLLACALLVLGLSCGSTGGGADDPEGDGFVSDSCNPDSSCLSLSVNPRSLRANNADVAGLSARLVDASGTPVPGVQVCFTMEDPSAATIFDPAGGCGITDANGQLSGKLRARNRTGSFLVIVRGPNAFGLETRQTITIGQQCDLGLTPDSGTIAADGSQVLEACVTCTDNTVGAGFPVTLSTSCDRPQFDGGFCDLSPNSGTTGQDGCVRSTLVNRNRANGSRIANVNAQSDAGSDSSTFTLSGGGE